MILNPAIYLEERKGLNEKYKITKVLGGGGCSNTFIAQLIEDPTKVHSVDFIYIYIYIYISDREINFHQT